MFKFFFLFASCLVFATPTSNRQLTGTSIKNGTSVLTLPASGNDTLVGRATTDTLTNKSIDGGSNTITGITGLTNTALSNSAGISFSKLAALTSGHVLVGSSGNVATDTAVSGVISISNTGVTSLSGTVPIANGGTNNGSLAVTAGGMLYTDGSKIVNVGAGSAGQYLASNGSSAPTWNARTPTTQTFLAANYYTFTLGSPGNVTAGATYTNNGQTFTAVYTIVNGTPLYFSGTGNATTSGTLTKSGGTGDSSMNFSSFTSQISYQAPAGCVYLRARGVGGGGGGSGGGAAITVSGVNGSAGGSTTFGSMVAAGGSGGSVVSTNAPQGGAGGTTSLQTGYTGLIANGAAGNAGFNNSLATGASTIGLPSGSGGSSFLGGAGGSIYTTQTAIAGVINTGGGGGGGSCTPTSSVANVSGGGGGAGAYFDVITACTSGYAIIVGAGGAGGSAASNGFAGGAGGRGGIWVEEYY